MKAHHLTWVLIAALLCRCAVSKSAGPEPTLPAPSGGSVAGPPRAFFIDPYRPIADKIIAAALADDGAYLKLQHLTDRIGNRLSGTHALDEAIAWAKSAMTADGVSNVRAEPVTVPHWTRGQEAAAITSPIQRPMHVLALGGSIGTSRGGIT